MYLNGKGKFGVVAILSLKKPRQHAKKVVSDSSGLVDFAFRLVNSVLNLSDRQANFLGKFKLQKDGNQSC